MKKRIFFICFLLIIIASFVLLRVFSTMGSFVIIPEPFFPMSEDYSPDKKMIDYYEDFFKSKKAEEVIVVLDRYDVRYFFEGGNRIYFEVSKSFAPVLARFSGYIEIEFKNGVFDRVVSVGRFGLITP